MLKLEINTIGIRPQSGSSHNVSPCSKTSSSHNVSPDSNRMHIHIYRSVCLLFRRIWKKIEAKKPLEVPDEAEDEENKWSWYIS